MTQTILITGAAGRIGRYLTENWRERYRLVLTDIDQPKTTHGFPFHRAELSDYDAIRPLFDDIDTVVHLGADPRMNASWESLLPNNIVAVRNVFEAAHQARCRRVVFASTINTVAGYPPDTQPHTDMPVRPLNLYGASKVWGEAVARFYADQLGLSAICLRYGAVSTHDNPRISRSNPLIDMILTFDDLERLTRAAVEAPDEIHFGIYHGVSNNRYKRLDISDARRDLGYAPEDDSFELAERNDRISK